MNKTRGDTEMPFLDHLEELRWRIAWSVLTAAGGAVKATACPICSCRF